MHTLVAPSRSAGVPGRALAAFAVLVAGLAVAFVIVPPRLAATGRDSGLGERGHLVAAFRTAVLEYWRSGDRRYPPALQHVVDYWIRFHLIKGGIAALLLIVLGALTVLLWRTFLQTDRLTMGSRTVLASAGTAVPVLALSALAVVMANIQGAIAPFSSLLPFLIGGRPDPGLANALAQARGQLAGSHRTSGYTPPALDAMVSDFARYHMVLAVVAAAVLVALLGLSIMFWRSVTRVGSADRRTRRVLVYFGVFSTASALIVAVVLVANIGTAMDPAPALLAFFNGGF